MVTRREVIADLRRQIERLGGAHGSRKSLPFGVPALDRHLPGRGLTLGSLHEVIEEGSASEFAGTATFFAAGAASRLKRPGPWGPTRRDLFAPRLMPGGLQPARVLSAAT